MIIFVNMTKMMQLDIWLFTCSANIYLLEANCWRKQDGTWIVGPLVGGFWFHLSAKPPGSMATPIEPLLPMLIDEQAFESNSHSALQSSYL